MNTNQQSWSARQKELRIALTESVNHKKAIELFLQQHAMVHTATVSQSGLWSYEDEVLNDISEGNYREIPPGGEHSIAWCVYHIARCEDVTMNLLVAGSPQVITQNNWVERMKISLHHTGNEMDSDSIAKLDNQIDIKALRTYRAAVGSRTREIVEQLKPGELEQKVQASRIRKVWDEGAVVKAAGYIVDYWSKRTIAGLLLMPATRHNFVHLNEASQIKQDVKRIVLADA
jgi:hypothetical protein